jgi:uncharacterized coiled-coil DUF342 family protein
MVQAYAQQLLNQKEAVLEDPDASSPQSATQHPLYIATKRLMGALNRLERNLDRMTEGRDEHHHDHGQQLMLFARENEGLRQERENLNSAITMLQSQYSELHEVASTIYGKLDDSIQRLTHIIEH